MLLTLSDFYLKEGSVSLAVGLQSGKWKDQNQNKSQHTSIKWLNSSGHPKINNTMSLSLLKNVKLGFLRIAKISKRNKKRCTQRNCYHCNRAVYKEFMSSM